MANPLGSKPGQPAKHDGEMLTFSEENACPACGISFPELTPQMFSFNSPQGACPDCSGLGFLREVDPEKLVLDPDRTDRCDAPNGKPTGYLTYSRDDEVDIGTNWLVFIDLGAADGAYPGQFATIFRDNPVVGMPRLVLAELGLLTVHEHYSTAILTSGWSSVYVGDRVELK